MSKEKLYIFDTTLRDGAQTQGVDFSIDDKLKIAKSLDDLGVDYIEGGWPGANPTDIARDYERGGAACLSVLTDGPSFGGSLGDLEALQGVVKFPVRIKCATLAWNTLTEALASSDPD